MKTSRVGAATKPGTTGSTQLQSFQSWATTETCTRNTVGHYVRTRMSRPQPNQIYAPQTAQGRNQIGSLRATQQTGILLPALFVLYTFFLNKWL